MMSEWKTICLADIAESINTGLDAIRRAPIVEFETDIKCLRIQDISQNKSFENWGFTEVKPSDYEKYQLIKDDIIMARTCSTGICFLVKDNMSAVFNNGLARIRLNTKVAYPQFIYYIFKSKAFSNYISGISCGTSVQLNMKIGDLSKYEFKLPPISKQIEISNILSKLDQKIELNTQLNQTLEQIAQATFKSWFIDFDPVRAKAAALAQGQTTEQATLAAMQALSGKTPSQLDRLQTDNPTAYQQLTALAQAFPSELVEVEGFGEVPKGWGYRTADTLFDIGIGKTPPRKESEWFSENADDVQWISIKDMGNSGTYITKSSEYLTNQAVNKFNVKRIPADTVILSFKLTVGRVAITSCETTTNEAIAHFKLNNKKSYLSTEYIYLYLKSFDFNNLGSTSSIAIAVNSKTIKEMSILLPNIEVVAGFNQYVRHIFEQVKSCIKENDYLTETRDLLLPKLLNGEIEND